MQRDKQPSAERRPTFAQPEIRTTHYERDEFGIVSPSDLRRPKEALHVKVTSKGPEKVVSESRETSSVSGHVVVEPHMQKEDPATAGSTPSPIKVENSTMTAKEASDRESSFIDAFFAADEPKVYDRDLGNSKSWRQTALQRRGASNVVARPTARSFPIAKPEPPATREAIMIPSSQALVDNYPYPRPSPAVASTLVEKSPQSSRKEVGWSVPESAETNKDASSSNPDSITVRSTFEKLEKLPKDDIDFLTAEEIRAAMGTKKNNNKSSEEQKLQRQKLETDYATAKPEALDETVEAHVVNNYYVRRVQQEFERERIASEAPEVEAAQNVETSKSGPQHAPEPVQLESSIDRMRRWIEEGSASLTKHFWQDPIEAGAPTEADMQFAKQMAGLGKGRRLREHVSDDLEDDLPMCKPLLERLKNDENRVEHAVYLLKSPRKPVHGTEITTNIRTIRERRLRNTYERTERQFGAACQALRDLDPELVQKATNAFKRRLGIASRVLHKNHTLTRMLTWSAQARLDEPELERSKAELYSEILTRLATLRDTQLALARLMDHAVQTYGVSYKQADEALSRSAPASEFEPTDAAQSEEPLVRSKADAAATASLASEVASQKTAMQGLSDDGYARAPKQMPRRSFEEKRNPLAHSLFRPFNPLFESLGKKTEGEEAEEKLKEAFKQKVGDRKLVQEVRSAYEDTYGPITVEHRQVPQTKETISTVASDAKAFEMLEEDSVSQATTAVPVETAPAEPTAVEVANGEAHAIPETAIASSPVEPESSEPPTTATVTAEAATTTSQSAPSINFDATSTPITQSTAADEASTVNFPTHYTILVHDPQTDSLSITTSTSGPPRDTSPALPVHQALSTLKAPAKFIPYISSGLEVVTAKRHMLVLRDALDSTSSTRGFETISTQSSSETTAEPFTSKVNPIDGTTRLSPTGYSGVEQSREQLEKDFEERRQAAAATEAARSKLKSKHHTSDDMPRKKKGGVGGVVKTAIWASALCYVVGVTAEVLR